MIKKEKENQKQNQTDSTEHIHKNQKWIKKSRINAQKKLTPEMFKVYCDYSDELLLNSHSLAGRKKKAQSQKYKYPKETASSVRHGRLQRSGTGIGRISRFF